MYSIYWNCLIWRIMIRIVKNNSEHAFQFSYFSFKKKLLRALCQICVEWGFSKLRDYLSNVKWYNSLNMFVTTHRFSVLSIKWSEKWPMPFKNLCFEHFRSQSWDTDAVNKSWNQPQNTVAVPSRSHWPRDCKHFVLNLRTVRKTKYFDALGSPGKYVKNR